MSRGVDVNASYTLSESTSDVGPASDELDANLVQDVRDPFGPVQDGPTTRTDARHRVTISAIVAGAVGHPGGAVLHVSLGAADAHRSRGIDLNADGNLVDKTALAYRYTGLDESTGRATFEEAGAVRDGELQPPRAVLAAQPARQPRLPPRRRREPRGDRRGVQPVQRDEPVHPHHDAAAVQPPARRSTRSCSRTPSPATSSSRSSGSGSSDSGSRSEGLGQAQAQGCLRPETSADLQVSLRP